MREVLGPMKKGDRFVAFGDRRPAHRVYIEVQRVAKDGSWADIFACTWAVGWPKRQQLRDGALPYAAPCDWTDAHLKEQEADHMAMLEGAS